MGSVSAVSVNTNPGDMYFPCPSCSEPPVEIYHYGSPCPKQFIFQQTVPYVPGTTFTFKSAETLAMEALTEEVKQLKDAVRELLDLIGKPSHYLK